MQLFFIILPFKIIFKIISDFVAQGNYLLSCFFCNTFNCYLSFWGKGYTQIRFDHELRNTCNKFFKFLYSLSLYRFGLREENQSFFFHHCPKQHLTLRFYIFICWVETLEIPINFFLFIFIDVNFGNNESTAVNNLSKVILEEFS